MERIRKEVREQLAEYFKANPGPVQKKQWLKWKEEHPRFMSYPQLRAYRFALIKQGVMEGSDEEWEAIWKRRFDGAFPSPLNRARWVVSRMLQSKRKIVLCDVCGCSLFKCVCPSRVAVEDSER